MQRRATLVPFPAGDWSAPWRDGNSPGGQTSVMKWRGHTNGLGGRELGRMGIMDRWRRVAARINFSDGEVVSAAPLPSHNHQTNNDCCDGDSGHTANGPADDGAETRVRTPRGCLGGPGSTGATDGAAASVRGRYRQRRRWRLRLRLRDVRAMIESLIRALGMVPFRRLTRVLAGTQLG